MHTESSQAEKGYWRVGTVMVCIVWVDVVCRVSECLYGTKHRKRTMLMLYGPQADRWVFEVVDDGVCLAVYIYVKEGA